MTVCGRLTTIAVSGVILPCLLGFATAMAQEGRIYKHVDEKGNVVYSQTPPMSGAGASKLDTQPAYSGRGGYRFYPYDGSSNYFDFYGQEQYMQSLQQRQQQANDARSKRLAELEAECNRDRGTDCGNPEVLRNLESNKIPGRYYRR
jgi:hypothetical protein